MLRTGQLLQPRDRQPASRLVLKPVKNLLHTFRRGGLRQLEKQVWCVVAWGRREWSIQGF